MKFGFMAKHRGDWPVAMMCEALGVSRSGFYAWLSRPQSRRCRNVEEMAPHVRQSVVVSDRTYGARRVWLEMLELGYEGARQTLPTSGLRKAGFMSQRCWTCIPAALWAGRCKTP